MLRGARRQMSSCGGRGWVDDPSNALASKYSVFCLTVDTVITAGANATSPSAISPADVALPAVSIRLRSTGGSVDRIKSKYKIPLAIKGVATAEDAKLCLDHGVEYVYVSNHGGRQLDHGRGSADALPEVVEAVAGRAKVIVDGGFYRGTDVVKAIAMGASLVGLGRMQCYGLAAGGQPGIVRMLELMEDEIIRTMGLLGAASYGKLDPTMLHAAVPLANPAHVFSAFPHLDIAPYRTEAALAIGAKLPRRSRATIAFPNASDLSEIERPRHKNEASHRTSPALRARETEWSLSASPAPSTCCNRCPRTSGGGQYAPPCSVPCGLNSTRVA